MPRQVLSTFDRLDESYWAKRYVGAKRQEGLAANAAKLVASTSS